MDKMGVIRSRYLLVAFTQFCLLCLPFKIIPCHESIMRRMNLVKYNNRDRGWVCIVTYLTVEILF